MNQDKSIGKICQRSAGKKGPFIFASMLQAQSKDIGCNALLSNFYVTRPSRLLKDYGK